jgi:hypothetical protein
MDYLPENSLIAWDEPLLAEQESAQKYSSSRYNIEIEKTARLEEIVSCQEGKFKALDEKAQAAVDHSNRAREVAQATEDRGDSAKIALIFQMLSQIAPQFRFFKGPNDDSLYELEGGELRGISLAEWQAKGGTEPAPLTQEDLDKLLPRA